jgi:hypothetical protein
MALFAHPVKRKRIADLIRWRAVRAERGLLGPLSDKVSRHLSGWPADTIIPYSEI